ncbi:DUF3256 family protein [Bacteroides sp.]
MKQLSLTILLFILGVTACSASAVAQEAKTVFTNMPDSLSPLLTAVNRADCIDFLESKMRAQVTNRFGRKSEMTELSSDYIRMQMSPQSTWQMKLLPVNDSTKVVCVVSTACAPVCDSDIKFYTADWKELPADKFLSSQPVLKDFMEPVDTMDYAVLTARDEANISLVKADLSKTDYKLTFTLTTPDYMEKETAKKLKPFLRRPIVYVWSEGKFIPDTL